jgi:hypothetical protein
VPKKEEGFWSKVWTKITTSKEKEENKNNTQETLSDDDMEFNDQSQILDSPLYDSQAEILS